MRTCTLAIAVAALTLGATGQALAASSILFLSPHTVRGGGIPYPTSPAVSADGTTTVSGSLFSPAIRKVTGQPGQALGTVDPDDPWAVATGTSSDGKVVVGTSATVISGWNSQAFRWTPTTGMVGLGDADGGSFHSGANDVSASGSVVVGYVDNGFSQVAAFWTAANGWTGMGDLPGGIVHSRANAIAADEKTIVGSGRTENGDEAFVWRGLYAGMTGLGDLPGGDFDSEAWGISDDGSTIVGEGESELLREAVRWTDAGGIERLGGLDGGPDTTGAAYDASADGSVIVGSAYRGPKYEAFVWTEQEGMRSLEVILANMGVDLEGWDLTAATSISADGLTVVGLAERSGALGPATFIAVIPEPGTGLLVGSGLLALGKRRSAQRARRRA